MKTSDEAGKKQDNDWLIISWIKSWLVWLQFNYKVHLATETNPLLSLDSSLFLNTRDVERRLQCDIYEPLSNNGVLSVAFPEFLTPVTAGKLRRRRPWTFVDRFWASTCDRLKRSTACRRNSQILSRRPTRLLYNIHVGLSFDWVNSCSIQSETPKSSIFWLNSSRIRHF